MPGVVVVVPTYNERNNITRLTEQLLALPVPDLHILIVDDNSPDGTGQLADQLAANTKGRLNVMHRPGKQGLGRAYVAGFMWAIEHNYDSIMQMDADFSHDPKYVPQMIETLTTCDAVIGSRYTKGGRLDDNWSIWRKLLSWWANRVWVGVILHTPVADNTGGFRAWRRATLIGMDLQKRIKSNGYVFQVEITYVALRLGYQFKEIPIYFADRKYDQSKMSLSVQLEAALRVLQVGWRHRALTPKDRASETSTT